MSVGRTEHGIVLCSHLYAGHILQSQYVAIRKRLDYHIAIVLLLFIASAVFQHILECVG